VRFFFDTSVLIAAFHAGHKFHHPSLKIFASSRKNECCCGSHSLAEVYSVLTGWSGKDRVSQRDAMRLIANMNERLTFVSLTGEEYLDAIRASSALRLAGGVIHDAILGHCALKAGVEVNLHLESERLPSFGQGDS
jgi:predicted nucleic acid-binding protein